MNITRDYFSGTLYQVLFFYMLSASVVALGVLNAVQDFNL